MTNPATAADLQARFYRDLTPREIEIAQTWLDDAWEILLGDRPTLEDDIAAGTVAQATAVRVLVAMVSRVFSNPEGKVAENIDDYGYRRDSVVSAGTLYVTDDELNDVTPNPTGRRNSVRLVNYGQFP